MTEVVSKVANLGRALRVLIVEDSFMTARALTRMLQDFGAEVIGPVPSVQKAMEVLDSGACDAALLDINLGNETVEPVAARLEQTGLPFLFVSGYTSPKTLLENPKYKGKRLVAKPVEPTILRQAFTEVFGLPSRPEAA
jgi:CheY-like chemotaxis protein